MATAIHRGCALTPEQAKAIEGPLVVGLNQGLSVAKLERLVDAALAEAGLPLTEEQIGSAKPRPKRDNGHTGRRLPEPETKAGIARRHAEELRVPLNDRTRLKIAMEKLLTALKVPDDQIKIIIADIRAADMTKLEALCESLSR